MVQSQRASPSISTSTFSFSNRERGREKFMGWFVIGNEAMFDDLQFQRKEWLGL